MSVFDNDKNALDRIKEILYELKHGSYERYRFDIIHAMARIETVIELRYSENIDAVETALARDAKNAKDKEGVK